MLTAHWIGCGERFMYDNAGYAGTRLNGTIVMLKRKPVYVERVIQGMRVKVRHFGNDVLGKRQTVNLSDLNILDFKLGFLNKDKTSTYMARRTLRHDWRQGLRPNNVSSTNMHIEMSDIARALLQRYPTYKEAYDKVVKGKHAMCAWCPDFAIKMGGKVVWRYDVVGTVEAKDKIVLAKEFKFLTHALKDVTYGCCEVL